MKVVAFNGSPRQGGNTEMLLKEVLNEIKKHGIETELVQIGGKHIFGCKACGSCRSIKNKKCVFSQDIFNECFEKMVEADAIILGSPTYFAGMVPEMKALIDRAGYVGLANDGLLKHKIGAGVVAQRRGGATSVLESMYYMFLMSEMIIPGSVYWNFGVGFSKGDVSQDKEGLYNMKNLGENIVWLLNKIKN